MIKVNLFRPIKTLTTTPLSSPLPPKGSIALENLERFIKYRNYRTGAGIYRRGLTFSNDNSKVRVNTRSQLSDPFYSLRRYFSKMTEVDNALNQAILREIKGAEVNWRKLEKVLFNCRFKLNEKALEFDQKDGDPLLPILLPYETEALMYIRLIDAEIDSILKIFGLTKNSKI